MKSKPVKFRLVKVRNNQVVRDQAGDPTYEEVVECKVPRSEKTVRVSVLWYRVLLRRENRMPISN